MLYVLALVAVVVGMDVLFFRPDETMIAITAPSPEGASSIGAASRPGCPLT